MYKIVYLFVFLVFANFYKIYGDEIIVPKSIYFGDNKLYFSKNIRNKIQKRANSIRKWKFQERIDKANLLFPIIEPIMKQNNIPNDIKFLAMHESGLKIDCISHTKDYGIWALNACSIEECGLKVNDEIDERMHIIYSTEAMCKKMKNNYSTFKNWIDTILAYNLGLTGTLNFKKKFGTNYLKKKGRKILYLREKTPDYIIHVIANKLAFEKKIGRHKHPDLKLHVHEVKYKNKSLIDLIKRFKISPDLFFYYNKWSKNKSLSMDKKYKVLIPLSHERNIKKFIFNKKKISSRNYNIKKPKMKIEKLDDIFLINGLKGIYLKNNISLNKLCKLGKINRHDFFNYNDIDENHKIKLNCHYYFENKRNKGVSKFYVAKKGDTWWSVSQRFGLSKMYLLLYNNRSYSKPTNNLIKPGRILFLRHIRPKRIPIEYRKIS